MVQTCQFGFFTTFEWFNKDGVTVDLYHYHEVFVSSLRLLEELVSLVRKNGFADIVHFVEYIMLLLALTGLP